MAERRLSLAAWALATFDATLFVLVGVLIGHADGLLDDALADLNTAVGLALFLYLWALVVLGVRWALGRVSLTASSLRDSLAWGSLSGSVVGVVFLLTLVAGLAGPRFAAGRVEPSSLALIAAIGAGVAAVVGAVVGLAAALLNVIVVRAAGYALPPALDAGDAGHSAGEELQGETDARRDRS